MIRTAAIKVKDDTKSDFDNLKATVASTMSADEFLRVLMTVYRTQMEAMKVR